MVDKEFFEKTCFMDDNFLDDPLCDSADDALRMMVHVSKYLDTEFGKGFSAKHPEIVASVTQSAAMFNLADRMEKLFKMHPP